MKKKFWIVSMLFAGLSAPRIASAQDAPVTLILKSGEEINCRVADIWKGEIYFEATSAEVAYRFGDRVSLDNVALVKLKDGRALSPGEFVDYRQGRYRPAALEPSPGAQPPTSTPAKAEAQPGMRLTSKTLQTTAEKSETRIGLHMPEVPVAAGRQISFEVSQVADLLAELGLGGRLLYEASRGALANRKLTDSQQSLLEALKQSAVWQRRKADLRDAHQQAFAAFNARYGQQPDFLSSEFGFEPRQGATAFLEFVQYLHTTAAANVESEWQKVEQLLGRRGAAALLDLLNNYDDWYYFYGAELESQ
jgi:hypothetical protein